MTRNSSTFKASRKRVWQVALGCAVLLLVLCLIVSLVANVGLTGWALWTRWELQREQERAAAAEKMRSLNERLAELAEDTGTIEPDARDEVLVAKVQVLQQELVRIDMAKIGLEAQKQFLEATPKEEPDPAELGRHLL